MITYLRKTNQLIDAILKKGPAQAGAKPTALQERYIRQLYLQTPFEFLQKIDPVPLYIAALAHFEFINSRSHRQKWISRIYNPTREEHGWESERTIIELNIPDSPFILDSITAEILRHGYTVYEVIHPVIRMERDAAGHITHIHEIDRQDKPAESCMHLQISHISGAKDRNALEKALSQVLSYVHLAVTDWKQIVAKAKEALAELDKAASPHRKEEKFEAFDFLTWAIDNNFIFLGYRRYDFVDRKGTPRLIADETSDLGIFKAKPGEDKPIGLQALPEEALKKTTTFPIVEITKSSRKSIVHRPVLMDYIGVKIFDKQGRIIGEHRFLGLFTSAVYFQSATNIPIIRRKIQTVIDRSDFAPMSHNAKALMAILQAYPRDELLQITEDELLENAMGIVELAERPATRLFVRRDRYGRFVSCIVYIPRDRFNTDLRETVQRLLEDAFGGQMSDFYSQVSESQLARLHLLIRVDDGGLKQPDLNALEKKLFEVTNSWHNGLRQRLITSLGERKGEICYRNYVDAFNESYKQSTHFGGTFHDINKIEAAYKSGSITIELYKLIEDDELTYQIKMFQPGQLMMLSEVMPYLENMGFDVIDQHTYQARPPHQEQPIWILHFRLRVSRGMKIPPAEGGDSPISDIKQEFEEALYKIWHREIENDALNKLILRAKMQWRDVNILRAYLKYTVQTSFPYSKDYMASAVARYPHIALHLINLFHARFNPARQHAKQAEKKHLEAIVDLLGKVENVVDDRVLRQFRDTILATLRTNAFQGDADNRQKPYISFKLDSAAVPNLPKPRPFREIFVYSHDMEGIHLRGGKVARGGLRWSDRLEDFRTEVLGLVKAQMVKNAVIVPVGSKGGFVVKHPVDGDRDARLKQGIACYQTFLRGLLDITDNLVAGKIAPPKQVVRLDEDDPYLVVAADKGTATFSDIANGISAEYGFWLGDAFASGGSAGYDHKKMGITARGGWVSVRRHFAEMGIDTQSQDFTVAGIGDMSGDVFGNGMLLSNHIRLIAAFNHMHIFFDPNPDAAKSFKERERLFNLPRSSWEDYDKKLISKGGGVFDRKAKFIELSKEVREALDVKESKLSPDEVIQAILKAPVDLLWNGGIGTYVKASDENHADVGDKANDTLRVNAPDLRAKVVGEGGNLGFTQKARIEYALRGGRINTDAIDNSAGVDCSDHEVNIKIALQGAMERGALTLPKRNALLESMTGDVAELVLRDNMFQTLALSIAEQQGAVIIEPINRLMRALEAQKLLDRAIEFLPNEDMLKNRQLSGKGFTRPELAVVMSYAKIAIYNELIDSHLPDDAYFVSDLRQYFPRAMQKGFDQDILGHALRREIIATIEANSIVNRMGSAFFYRIKEQTGKKGCDIARAYTIVRDGFGLRALWQEIEELPSRVPVKTKVGLFLEIRQLVERCVLWFLRHHDDPLDASTLVAEYKPGIDKLRAVFDEIMSDAVRKSVNEKQRQFEENNVPSGLAHRIALFEALASTCDIVRVSRSSDLPIKEVGRAYYRIGSRLHFGYLRIHARAHLSASHWDNLALGSIIETLYDQQMRLTEQMTCGDQCRDDKCEPAFLAWTQSKAKALAGYDLFMEDLMRNETITPAMLTVTLQRIDALL